MCKKTDFGSRLNGSRQLRRTDRQNKCPAHQVRCPPLDKKCRVSLCMEAVAQSPSEAISSSEILVGHSVDFDIWRNEMGRKRERRREERGSEESEFAQAPDSRGSQLLKRTKLVRLFFQQGENIALQNLDANRISISFVQQPVAPSQNGRFHFVSHPPLPSPLVSVSLRSKFASVSLRASALRVLPTRPRTVVLPNHLTGFDLSLFHFWQVHDDLLFVPPQSPHPALRRSEEER